MFWLKYISKLPVKKNIKTRPICLHSQIKMMMIGNEAKLKMKQP